ncbi:DUF4136 domain-containing protein [Chlorobaculum sp. 24CR]|uniref:DUF4136 domain-containing protein n=1 Tax=Chlorobaculum sp. 24CR TaxID=2508878 RepID=UPI00100C1A97|nr:DUF4136 domain-containing protein [Chlorobaculum sp. 24CR]RXK82477.1 DUF4136 domain-containing protein [Chlorobaculum sp. 24CR]
MRTRFWIFPLIALLTLAGCSNYRVVSDYDRSMPFERYKTYRWSSEDSAGISDDILARNPFVYKHIKSAVDRELAAKGFVLKASGPVDFTVALHARVRERVVVAPPVGFAYSRGYYHRWGRHGYTTIWYDPYPYPAVSYYEEGTLIIDIIDTRSDDIAWSGIARGILKDYDTSLQMQRDIDEVVTKIMVQFPPLVR